MLDGVKGPENRTEEIRKEWKEKYLDALFE